MAFKATNGDKPPLKHEPIKGSKKRGFVYDSYQDMTSFKQKPIAYAFLEQLAEKILDWSLKDTSLRIESFYMDLGIRQQDYYRFMERCSELKDSHEIALQRIAIRRDTGALTKKYDASWAARTQAAFDSEYRKARQFEASLQKEKEDNGQRLLVIERFPETSGVKKLETKEE